MDGMMPCISPLAAKPFQPLTSPQSSDPTVGFPESSVLPEGHVIFGGGPRDSFEKQNHPVRK